MNSITRIAAALCLVLASATSSVAVVAPGNSFDGIPSLIYDVNTGNVYLENGPAPNPFVSRLNIMSGGGILLDTNLTYPNLSSPPVFVNNIPNGSGNQFQMDLDRTGLNFLGTGSFLGNILPPFLSFAQLEVDLTVEWATGPNISNLLPGDLIHSNVVGATQSNPVLPTGPIQGGFFRFFDVASGQFFDPPMATGYAYDMVSDSLFTGVGLPLGLGSSFTIVSSEGVVNGVGEGEYHSFSGGVSNFKILGINPPVDATNPAAFPVFLDFFTNNAEPGLENVASFNITPIPEPSTMMLLAIAFCSAIVRSRRGRAS